MLQSLRLFVWNKLSRLVVATIVVWLPLSASADQRIKDPKAWADSLVSLVADGEVEKVIDEFTDSSGGLMPREKMQVSMGAIIPLVARAGSIRSTDLLAERHYGRSFVAFWYYLLFEKQELFVRLRLVKRGEYWQVQNFSFQTDFDKLDVPD